MKKFIVSPLLAAAFLLCSPQAFAADWRGEFGIGAHGGDPEFSFAGVTDDLDTDTGIALSGQIWADGLIEKAPWLSLGVQYLRLQDADFNESVSASILGVTVTGQLDLEPTIDTFLVNAAYRGKVGSQDKLHPFIGGGIGFARSSVDAFAAAAVTVNGQTLLNASANADDDDTNLAWQFFAGADYDVTDKMYVGATFRYLGTDATLFGADVEFRNFVGMASIGYKF